MDWIFDNPIGRMPGPTFLALYTVWFILWLFVARFIAKPQFSAQSDPLPLPQNPDPFRIAYLRGGVPEVLRTVLVDLVEKKRVIEVKPKRQWYQFGNIPSKWTLADSRDLGSDLTTFHQVVINGLRDHPCTIPEAMRQLWPELFKKSEQLRTPLQQLGLIYDEDQVKLSRRLSIAAILSFASLGVYKFVAAVTSQHFNVMFLLGGTVFGVIVLFLVSKRNALTNRGVQYLKDLRLAYASLKSANQRNALETNDTFSEQLSPTLLAMSIFGLIALKQSDFDPLVQAFGPVGLAASSPNHSFGYNYTGGCGSGGCGSGGCGSSGCGSGGCGGGGCGGCGGG